MPNQPKDTRLTIRLIHGERLALEVNAGDRALTGTGFGAREPVQMRKQSSA